VDTPFPELTEFRTFSRLVAARAQLAQRRGRADEAASDYLLNYRLGAALSHGGSAIHAAVGLSLRNTALEGLGALLPSLTSSKVKQLRDPPVPLNRRDDEAGTRRVVDQHA
jgi:hypothetical protein